MSTPSYVFSASSEQDGAYISFRFLLGLYAIVPLCLLTIGLDSWLFNRELLDTLPSSPGHYLLFQILFGTPHILASNLLLFSHKEYRQRYRGKLIGITCLIVLVFGLGSLWLSYRTLYVLSACWTVYHVLKQQHGVAKAVCRLPNHAFYLQLWLGIAAGIAIYFGVFLKNSLTSEQAQWCADLAWVFCAASLCSTCFCQRYVSSQLGLAFLWANCLLVVASCLVYSLGYYFFAILMPRLVHDITAYSFYINHDINRHGSRPDNDLHRLAKSMKLPAWLVLPLLSFLLTFILQAYGDSWINAIAQTLFATEWHKAVSIGLIGYLALMHYYTESFLWTSGSPLRRYIRFNSP